ncbi:hypothetical protein K0M31_003808 [Melipona bicolor]|uniref:Glutathione transferase n=1 Tax=Melipona bicolor TaxID=60889 RepID=A0AA40FXZ0_9HYME|nr:hypothetical protein K0M31_003808 [Melipona bicolor]
MLRKATLVLFFTVFFPGTRPDYPDQRETMDNIANKTNEHWAIHTWWSCILILKMNSLTWLTGRVRLARRVIHSEEDRVWFENSDVTLSSTGDGHVDLDRIRSMHRYDLATVLPYLLITPIWLITSPSIVAVRTILPCFTIINLSHTLLYTKPTIDIKRRYCMTILSLMQFCILFYMSVVSTLYYAF